MSYLTQNEISSNQAMQNRVAQAAAKEPKEVIGPDPDQWMFNNRRNWSSAPGWDAAWESARVNHPEEGYDPGMDEGVITDSMILSQIQAMGAA